MSDDWKQIVTHQDLILFDQCDKETLANWWCLLNSWKWPEMLADEDLSHQNMTSTYNEHERRSGLMREIESRVTQRLISWIWNKERMTKEEHDDFFSGTFEGNAAAKKRDQARQIKKHNLPEDFFNET